jgi:uncharacterized membrane protein YfcA
VNTFIIPFFVVLVISSIFSMFGKGGGSLYTPVLVMLGLGVKTVIPTSLFLNLVTALVATVVFARNKLVEFKFSSIFLPGTIVGSLLGALLSSRAPISLLLGIFSAFLAVVGAIMIFTGKGKKKQQPEESRVKGRRAVTIVVLFSFGVGVLSSLIGVGGGLIIFPFLVLYIGYNAQKAAGANAYIVTVSSIVGSLGHMALGEMDYLLLGVTIPAVIIGSAIGSCVTVKASPKFVTVAFGCILWFFSAEIALHQLGVV